MKRTFLFKCLISVCLLLGLFLAPKVDAKQITYVSLAPSITEIIYALGAQDGLLGVTSECNYPKEAKEKENLGSVYGVNKEKILRLKPDYILALDSSKPFLGDVEEQITIKYFTFNTVEDILNAITGLGEFLGKKEHAKKIVKDIREIMASPFLLAHSGIKNYIFNSTHSLVIKPSDANRKVFYVVQSEPLITIGKKSYLTDVIRLSGNVSVTSDIAGYYPSISLEHAIRLSPDYVIVGPYANIKQLYPIFKGKNVKFVHLTKYQNDVINRPGPRVGEAIRFFSSLK